MASGGSGGRTAVSARGLIGGTTTPISAKGLDDLTGLIDMDAVVKNLGGQLIGYLGQRLIMELVLLFLVSSLLGNIRLGDFFGRKP